MSRALIVCEDAPTRSLIGDVVSRDGHRAVVVSSAAAARELVEREPIDVVVVDLATRDADGPAKLWSVDARKPRPPILAVAGPARDPARERAFEAAASGFVFKPIDERALRSSIRTLVELGRLRAAQPPSPPVDDRAAEQLRASEARYRAMIMAIPDLLFRLDREHRFIDVSASDPSQLALPPQAMIGKTVAEVYGGERPEVAAAFRPTFIDQVTAAIDRAFAAGELQRFDYEYLDRWFEARIVRSGPDEVVAIARDVTTLRDATRELEHSRARLDFLVNASPSIVYTCSASPPFGATFVSANVADQLGWPPEVLTNDPGFWADHIHPEDAPRVSAELASVFEHGAHELEYRFLHRDGEYRWMRDVVRLIRGASGEAVEMIGAWTDVTERRRAEEALRAAVRARDDLLAVVSHDLRSPVSTVRLSAEALAQHPREDDRRRGRKQLEAILRATDRMTRLIDDLLQAAMIEAGTFSVTLRSEAPRPLVDEALHAIEPVAAKRSVQVGAELPSTLPEIRCDRQRLIQVLLNLLGNAVKFSPSGGTVRVAAVPEGGELRVSVSDQGPGIAADSLPYVFDRYWKRPRDGQEGAGLGLYIAKGIVDAHGGRIWAESQLGTGTTIYFTVPLD